MIIKTAATFIFHGFSITFVKINSTFVNAIMDDPVHFAMVRSMNDVAHTLGKQTIAASVESADVLEKLHELGVNLVQGQVCK